MGGEVTIGDRLQSGILLSNRMALGCDVVHCGGAYPVLFGRQYNAILVSLPSPPSSSYQFSSSMLTNIAATARTASPAPRATEVAAGAVATTTTTATTSSLVFVIENGQVTVTNAGASTPTMEADTGRTPGRRVVAYGENQFPDQIVSSALSAYSTTIVAGGGVASAASSGTILTISAPSFGAVASDVTSMPAPIDVISSLVSTIKPSDLTAPTGMTNTQTIADPGTTSDTTTTTTSTTTDAGMKPGSSVPGTGTGTTDMTTDPTQSGLLPVDAPEPASVLLMGTGLLALVTLAARRRNRG